MRLIVSHHTTAAMARGKHDADLYGRLDEIYRQAKGYLMLIPPPKRFTTAPVRVRGLQSHGTVWSC